MSLTFDEYQLAAGETAIYPEAGTGNFSAVAHTVLGLANEAGEVAGKLKKIWRDQDGVIDDLAATNLAAELGGVLWYLAATASELGFSLEDLAHANMSKLRSRKERNVIGGSGDDR